MGASNIAVRRIREVTPGVTPGGNMGSLEGSGLDLNDSYQAATPQDVAGDRQPRDGGVGGFSGQTQWQNDLRYNPGEGAAGSPPGARAELLEEAFGRTRIAAYDTGVGSAVSIVAAGNKLVQVGGWGALSPGSDVVCENYPTNGGDFRVHITSISGDDAFVDANEKTLVDESPASSRVYNDGTYRLGVDGSLLTATYERWNSKTGRGYVVRGVACTQWQLSGSASDALMREQWSLIYPNPSEELQAQLANGDDAIAARPPVDFYDGFLYPADAGLGFGFYVNGVEQTALEFSSFQLTVSNPAQTRQFGGRGFTFEIEADQVFQVGLQLVLNKTSDAELDALEELFEDPQSREHVAFGWVDSGGRGKMIRLPELMINGRPVAGVAQSGIETVTYNLSGYEDADHTALQVTDFTGL